MEVQEQKSHQRNIRCVVVSDKMDKSRVAKVERKVKHPIVGKYIKRTTKYFFHDEKNQSKLGDEVFIAQVPPISKKKTFNLVSIEKVSEQ